MSWTVVIVGMCATLAVVLLILFVVFGRKQASFTLDIGGAAPKAAGGKDASHENTVSHNLYGLAIAVGSTFALLLARIWSMQLVSSDYWSEQAESNRTRTVTTLAPRGRILDRNGVELVTNRPSLCVKAESSVLDNTIELQLLANVLGMPMQAVRRKIQDTTEGAQSKRTVAVDVSKRQVAYLYAHEDLFPGVEVEQRTQRSYPKGQLAAHVLGYTGTVTQEQLEAQSTDGITYQSGDIVGQTGVEYQYESVLQGVRGEQLVYVDAGGNVLEYSTSIESKSGSDVMLTIDAGIQEAAEKALLDKIEYQRSRGYGATDGACVVLDCTNGEVLAMASYPTFSPATFVGGISSTDWDALNSEDSHYPMLNRAVAGLYPAGSTSKAFTTMASLDYGIATGSSSWYCGGWWTGFGEAYGKWCWNHNGHGGVNLVSAITYSCDVAFYEIAKGFWNSDNKEGIQATFRRFGWGTATGIDLPNEASGRVPDAEWKWNYFSKYAEDQRRWVGGDTANIAIGQGDVLITCLQLANSYCGIANNGNVYRPHVLKNVLTPSGTGSVIDYAPEVMLTPDMNQDYRSIVYQGLQGVVYRESTNIAKHWTNIDIQCAGKTGTAQVANNEKTVGLFAGFFPADDPKYVIASIVNDAYSGETSSMYITRDIIGYIYNQPDTASVTSDSGEVVH